MSELEATGVRDRVDRLYSTLDTIMSRLAEVLSKSIPSSAVLKEKVEETERGILVDMEEGLDNAVKKAHVICEQPEKIVGRL